MFYIICWCYPFLANLFPLRKKRSSMLRTLELNRWLERGNTYYFCPATATEFKLVGNSQIHFPLQTWAKGCQHTIKFSFHNPVVGFFTPACVWNHCAELLGYFYSHFLRFIFLSEELQVWRKASQSACTFVPPFHKTSWCHRRMSRIVLLIEHRADV